jgi:hypothetical protein
MFGVHVAGLVSWAARNESQSKVRWSKSLVFGVGPPWTALATKPTPTLRHCDARQLFHAEANRERDRGGDLFFPIPGLGSQVK